MSESLRKSTAVVDEFGAALRFFLMNSRHRAGRPEFDEGVREVAEDVILPVERLRFFVAYANITASTAAREAPRSDARNTLDRWILSACEGMVAAVTAALEASCRRTISPIVDFIDSLNDWYIRRCEAPLLALGPAAPQTPVPQTEDESEAYATLHQVPS